MTQREPAADIADPIRSGRAADDLVRRARLLDGAAKTLLDEAARIARRHRLGACSTGSRRSRPASARRWTR